MNKFILNTNSDIGTSTPWVARCGCEILRLRDQIIFDEEKKKFFDMKYDIILTNLESAYKSKEKLKNMIITHANDFSDKKNYTETHNCIKMKTNIDSELNDQYSNLIIKLHTAIKDIQGITKIFNYDIGFFYSKNKTFEDGKLIFLKEFSHMGYFMEMLTSDREWFSMLNKIRNDYNHSGYKLENIEYHFNPNIIKVPKELSDIKVLWENGWRFIEDILVSVFNEIIDPVFEANIVKIKKKDRDQSCPIKYIIN